MTLSTRFEGDPESCWRVARRLDVLAETLEDAARYLGHQQSLPAEDFEGLSGAAYRVSAGRLRADATAGATAHRALAVALDEFAANLDGVRRVLRRARGLAREHLVIHGLEIQEPGPYADARQREVFAMVRGAVEEARRIEHQAHHDWQAALATHAGTAPPAPAAPGLFGPQPDPDPLPHPDARPDDRPDDPPDDRPDDRPDAQPLPGPESPGAGTGGGMTPAASPVPAAPSEDDWRQVTAEDWQPTPAPELIEWELSDGPR